MEPLASYEANEVYEKVCNGAALSDREVVAGYSYFVELADKMWKLGPVFKLSAVELGRVYRQLESFAEARGLKIR